MTPETPKVSDGKKTHRIMVYSALSRHSFPQEKLQALCFHIRALQFRSQPALSFNMWVLSLMVASFEVVPYTQSTPDHCNSGQAAQSLNYPIHLTRKTILGPGLATHASKSRVRKICLSVTETLSVLGT